MGKIFTFVPTNSLLTETHRSFLVLQSGEEFWSIKQVILREIQLIMY